MFTDLKAYAERRPTYFWVYHFGATYCLLYLLPLGAIGILNAAVIGLETDLAPEEMDQPVDMFFEVMEHVFCVVWTLEMCAKLFFLRFGYFLDSWNRLDCMLALLSIIDSWVLPLR